MRVETAAEAAALLFAAGYLLGTRRRSRRAATAGLCGVGLLGLPVLESLTGWGFEAALRAVWWGDDRSRQVVNLWAWAGQTAAGYGLLVAAVVLDRPPPAD